MEITVRNADESDFPQLIELFREFALFERLPEKMVNSLDRMKNEKNFFRCFVAELSDKQIIGYAAYFFCYYTWSGKSLYLDDLYVKPEYRGSGVGAKLLNTVIDLAKISQCRKVRWQVSGWNKPAIEFYEKLGATIDSVEQNCDLTLD